MHKTTLGIGLYAVPLLCFALGLGNVQLQSFLGEPLSVEVPLTEVGDIPLEDIQAQLASADRYEQLGLERSYTLTQLKFKVMNPEGKAPVVLVTSREAIEDPYLCLFLSVTWTGGQLYRQYNLLLDPPPSVRPPVLNAPPMTVAVPAATVKAPTPAFAPISTSSSVTPVSLPPSVAAQASTASVGAATGIVYGVQPRDTMSAIAQKNKARLAGTSGSLAQWMLAIQQKNPQAFIRHNINGLLVGQTLSLPSVQEVQAMPAAMAVKEVAAQTQAWHTGRDWIPAIAPAPVTAVPDKLPSEALTASASASPQAASAAVLPAVDTAVQSAPSVETPPSTSTPVTTNAQPEATTNTTTATAVAAPVANLPNNMNSVPVPPDAISVAGGSATENTMAATTESAMTTPTPIHLQAPNMGSTLEQANTAAAPASTIRQQELSLVAEAVKTARQANQVLKRRLRVLENQNQALQKTMRAKDKAFLQLTQQWTNQMASGVSTTTSAGVLTKESSSEQGANAWVVTLLMTIILFLMLLLGLLSFPLIKLWKEGALPPLLPLDLKEKLLSRWRHSRKKSVAEPTVEGEWESAVEEQDNSAIVTEATVTSTTTAAPIQENVINPNELQVLHDSLEEADVYVSFGRYADAEKVLAQAAERWPHQTDLQLKFLQLYAISQNRQGFDNYVKTLAPALQQDAEVIWRMNATAEANVAVGVFHSLEQGKEIPVSTVISPEPSVEDKEQDTVIDLSHLTEETASISSAADSAPVSETVSEENRVLDFESGLGDGLTVKKSGVERGSDERDIGSEAEAEQRKYEAMRSVVGKVGVVDPNDPIVQKLSEAKNFITTGEKLMARQILIDVLARGNENQRREAQELLLKASENEDTAPE